LIKYVWIVSIGFFLLAGAFFIFVKWMNSSNPDYVVKKLQDTDIKSSMVFKENGEDKVSLRSSDMLSLASTVKIMVALEYAFQSSEGKIDGDEGINLKELETYYLPKLDGGAHEAWIAHGKEQGYIKNDSVSLREVARGMISFSSNANTEFLMDKLGIENIEARMKDNGITSHSPLFYFVSATFIPYELNGTGLDMKDEKEDIINRMQEMNEGEWVAISEEIHEKLYSDDEYKVRSMVLDWWDSDFDRLFSEKFMKSTAGEYARLMSKINNQVFNEEVQGELEYLLGAVMENPANQEWLNRAGKKGGSTQYILTDAMFAEDKKGNKFELAIFFNDLGLLEGRKLMVSLNEFELKLLSDAAFRDEVYQKLMGGTQNEK
jgi:D-alanyl-D-alanine carboxypeptidase